MTLAHPGWLALLLLLPLVLLGGLLTERQRSQAWQRMVAPRLRHILVQQISPVRRWTSLALGLAGACLLVLVLARPQAGHTTTIDQSQSRNVLIAIDTSRSMLVRDGSPDRLAAAKAMALELITALPNDRIGVIAFSGASVLMAPLTVDHPAVHETISQLDTHVIPSGGSDLTATVQLALETFEKTGQSNNALILISDGEDHSEKIDTAANAIRQSRATVCAIGVGSSNGGIIPDPNQSDGKFRDRQGQTVLSRLTPQALDVLARAGAGNYQPASAGASTNVRNTLASLERYQQAGKTRTIPDEQYQWFLLPAVILLGLSVVFRSEWRPRIMTRSSSLSLLLVLLTSHLSVGVSPLEQAGQAYRQKEYSQAQRDFQQALEQAPAKDAPALHFAIGSAAYRLEQWGSASHHFSNALLTNQPRLREHSHYNLAQSLFRSGLQSILPSHASESNMKAITAALQEQLRRPTKPAKPADSGQQPATETGPSLKRTAIAWEDAIDHYQATLDINPDNQAAHTNQTHTRHLLTLLLQTSPPPEKRNQDEQGHHPETDPNHDPENPGQQDPENKNEGDPNAPNDAQDGDQGKPEKPSQQDPSDGNQPDPSSDPSDNSNDRNKGQSPPPDQPADQQRQQGESDEAYSARILKQNSDAETRPVKRRFLKLRRPAKDW